MARVWTGRGGTRPRGVPLAATIAAALVLGCGGASPQKPTALSGSAGTVSPARSAGGSMFNGIEVIAPGPGVTIGTVYEHTDSGPRLLPALRLQVSNEDSGHETSFMTSDAEGRYEISLSQRIVKVVPAAETGYLAPCPAGGNAGVYQPILHVIHRDVRHPGYREAAVTAYLDLGGPSVDIQLMPE